MRYGTKQILLLGLCFWFGKNCFGMKETGDAQKAITTLRGWIQMRPGSDTYSDEIKQDDIKNYVLRIAKTKNCDLKVEIEGEHRSVPVIADIILEAAKIKDKYDDIFQKLGNCLVLEII